MLISGIAMAVLPTVPTHAQQEGDPPAEIARVSVMLGDLSVEPASARISSAQP
jgi:hypothetical protein